MRDAVQALLRFLHLMRYYRISVSDRISCGVDRILSGDSSTCCCCYFIDGHHLSFGTDKVPSKLRSTLAPTRCSPKDTSLARLLHLRGVAAVGAILRYDHIIN